jgi:hypothetical protein
VRGELDGLNRYGMKTPMKQDTSPSTGNDLVAIRSVILEQVEAFRSGDHLRAFACASTGIQAKYSSAEAFGAMVQNGYPQIYRPRRVEFGPLNTLREVWVQPVEITGEDGITLLTLYLMAREPSGEWRIDGVLQVHLELDEHQAVN